MPAAPYQGLYEGIEFGEYEFKEYPKFIQTGEKVDLSTKTKTPTGVLVYSEAEEAALTATGKPPVRDEDERTRLLKVAKQAGVEVDARWGLPKIEAALVAAKIDTDHDPDA